MDASSHTPRSLKLYPLVILALLLGLFRAVRRVRVRQPDMGGLLERNQALEEEASQLAARVAELEQALTVRVERRRALGRTMLRRAPVLLLAAVLVAAPSGMVVAHRWLQRVALYDTFHRVWCSWAFLCDLGLPSYFVVIIASFMIVLASFWIFAAPRAESYAVNPGVPLAGAAVDLRQMRIGKWLLSLSAAAGLMLLALGVLTGRTPKQEYPLVVLCYVAGVLLLCVPVNELRTLARSIPGWVLPWLLALATLLAFLQSISGPGGLPVGVSAVLLALGFANLLRFRSQIGPVVWVITAGLALMTWQIGSWQFSVVGDEFSFFSFGREIAREHDLWTILSRLFDGQGVYGSHPYFSSLIHAAGMLLFGADNFGWRVTNPLMIAASISFFYLFFKRFLGRGTALIVAALLGASHYLMTFGKIGYNNPQALLAMGLVLWTAGRAVTRQTRLDYTWLGLSMGLCLYVYPAALYLLVLPLLLIALYDPPVNRPALQRCLALLAPFCLLLLPVLLQPGYWLEKIPGTFFQNPEIIVNGGLGYHLASNLIYALFSYVYTPQESHFVYFAYLDPLSACLVPLGLAWSLRLARRQKFAAFLTAGFVLLLVLVGVTHDRQFPSTTRMFLLLPFFFAFAALGLAWLGKQLQSWGVERGWAAGMAAVFLLLAAGLNFYQAYHLTQQQSENGASLEMTFLRLLQRGDPGNSSRYSYVFITDPQWGIDGLRVLADVYGRPSAQAQLLRYPTDSAALPPDSTARIEEENTLVILQPWLPDDWLLGISNQLNSLGKLPCPVRANPQADIRFVLWYSPPAKDLCPNGGVW